MSEQHLDNPATPHDQATSAPVTTAPANTRIVFVEDDDLFRESLMRNLQDEKSIENMKASGFSSSMRDVAKSSSTPVSDDHPVAFSDDFKSRTAHRKFSFRRHQAIAECS